MDGPRSASPSRSHIAGVAGRGGHFVCASDLVVVRHGPRFHSSKRGVVRRASNRRRHTTRQEMTRDIRRASLMGRFIFLLSSNLRSVVYLSPSFVVRWRGIPSSPSGSRSKRPTPRRDVVSLIQTLRSAQTNHTQNTTRYSATSRRCSIDKLVEPILRIVDRERGLNI